jgi:transposase
MHTSDITLIRFTPTRIVHYCHHDVSDDLDMASLLSSYKAQQNVEKDFRFLKSPDFLTSAIYLKKPERIEALLMVMTSCLMVYASFEHQIRKTLKDKACYFHDQKKSQAKHPLLGGFSNASKI